MTKTGSKLLSMLLWFWGGTVYFLLEVIFKTCGNEPEKISWTMLVLAIFLVIPIERGGSQCPWEMPLPLQALICAGIVTCAEFIAGCILNLWLQLNIWDYSNLWGNVLGQICPQFILLWFILCLIFIPVFDWMRWFIDQQGDKPHYQWR